MLLDVNPVVRHEAVTGRDFRAVSDLETRYQEPDRDEVTVAQARGNPMHLVGGSRTDGLDELADGHGGENVARGECVALTRLRVHRGHTAYASVLDRDAAD